MIKLQYIIISNSCWCTCCVQTSTLQSFFQWSKSWNQIYAVYRIHS